MNKSIALQRMKKWVIFSLVYFVSFAFIEKINTDYFLIHTVFDEMIPFCEYFVWPYLLWFPYVALTVLYFALVEKDSRQNTAFYNTIVIGSIIFVVVSLLIPNGQNMRPVIASDSISKALVNMVWMMDTPTNILPSLHVYNTVACFVALKRNKRFSSNRLLMAAVSVLSVSIVLSTMFLKQHSVVDVIAALMCNCMVYSFAYGEKMRFIKKHAARKNKWKRIFE